MIFRFIKEWKFNEKLCGYLSAKLRDYFTGD